MSLSTDHTLISLTFTNQWIYPSGSRGWHLTDADDHCKYYMQDGGGDGAGERRGYWSLHSCSWRPSSWHDEDPT